MWTGESLFFFTDLRSRKAANMKNNPSIAAIVTEQDADFFSAKSVEVYGTLKGLSAKVQVLFLFKKIPLERGGALAAGYISKLHILSFC